MAINRGRTVTFNATVPAQTAKDIKRVARKIGVTETVFTAMALAMGTRALDRVSSPEDFFPQALIDAMAKAGLDLAKDQIAAAEQYEKA
jgi:hypothetical protein